MCIRINSYGKGVQDAIINGPTPITLTDDNGVVTPISEAQWNGEDKKNWGYNYKIQNILISSLGVDEYYRVSHCEQQKLCGMHYKLPMRELMKSNKLESIN